MGNYINPGNDKFKRSKNSKIYIDKSNLIVQTNEVFNTRQAYICISRPRRFGKTMAAEMLAAYYGIGEDAHPLFENLAIANHPTYEEHLNKHNVIMINMQVFLSKTKQELLCDEISVFKMLSKMRTSIIDELVEDNSEIKYKNKDDFIQVMQDTYHTTKKSFVIIIDEWDCLFREYKDNAKEQKRYLDFLRLWLKDQAYVGLAYMTGILPIKKYGSHSALNMFREYSMTNPRQFLNYFGFQASEVEDLAKQYKVDFEEIKQWYNGYFVDLGTPIYNPTSVTECLESNVFASYWSRTETYEALKDYIRLNFDGLKNRITRMIAGHSVLINPDKFINDMTTFNSVDDVLTLLVHLGYLTYNFDNKTVQIPNQEVKYEFVNSIEDLEGWDNVVNAINQSDKLLKAIWNKEADLVATGIEKIHEQNTAILTYNDENSLSCVLSLALYTASNYYTIIRELPAGKGYADLVFIPRKKHTDRPAMVVELKWNKTVEGAISQIRKRNYICALDGYHGNLLLVGINYEKESKIHECSIETLEV